MVVISEQFRELEVNQRFHAYATTADFRVHACCGYAPESKGKVEAGVKYAKQDAFYGETFRDEADLRCHVQQWLDEVANVRLHGTTGRQPQEHFMAEERAHLLPYLMPACLGRDADGLAPRKFDKTGLIAWKANRYSVPMAYQQGRVGAREADGRLAIHDLESGEEIATHALHLGKGYTSRNENYYRDHRQQEADLEQAIAGDLTELLAQAEANEVSYLAFANMLVEHERQTARRSASISTSARPASPATSDWKGSTTDTRPPSPSARSAPCSTSPSSTTARTWCSSAHRGWARPTWPSASARRPSRPATECCFATPCTWSRSWRSP
ncbi:hypothetical protein HHA01_14990 [Halomonas halmophila]|uniref:Integrase catalytic domain-containing protein n=1 Tax=Halomonas halmophila TaxID=252 RepID=A0A4Y4EX51_9GAMM|nr:hypothetical protein HHA01_14990 [Halomonas halmophila]